ncbi:MAG: sigma 54-interacting transcriptional regulator [Kofleriaceae bacterium]
MALARIVVVDGPDAGREFDLPLRGGGVGRGEGNLIQLADPAVSRQHGQIELSDGALWWTDETRKGRTLINGKLTDRHCLRAGDEIIIGHTRMVFVPSEGVALTPGASHVTVELSTRQLLSLSAAPADQRAYRYLAGVAELGDRLRAEVATREATSRLAVESLLPSLGAERAYALRQLAGGGTRLQTLAAAGADATLSVPQDVASKVLRDRQVVGLELGGRQIAAAPLLGVAEESMGILWVERTGKAWEPLDLLSVGCVAHLLAGAWVSAEARDQLQRSHAALEERLTDGEFIGRSAAAQRVLDFVGRVAPSDATVLLGGESGSGKEMVARAIHRASRRAKAPCVAVNCAALTESLIESELFGHEKGAFTGATDKKLGRFEMADKGTLFLDEIGELPLALQTKFLRVLEERRFERVGGTRTIEVDVRLVAATNRDLGEMARRGAFREDLYYRLSVIQVDVPPLRARLDDVPLLAEHFLARFRAQAGRRITGLSADAIGALMSHSWPGNVRELRNAIERAVVLGDGEQVTRADLPPHIGVEPAPAPAMRMASDPGAPQPAAYPPAPTAYAPAPPAYPPAPTAYPPAPTAYPPAPAAYPPAPGPAYPAAAPASHPPAPGPAYSAPPPAVYPPAPAPPAARSLRELEREGIIAALAATGGNKAQAAALLEIDRSTLYKKLKDYEIETP